MYIKEIHITAFGPITDGEITASRGLNIIEGENESGKSTVAAFIKFIFYGLSARGADGVPEKQKYINWERGVAAGHIVLADCEDGREYRIERTLSSRTSAEGKLKFSESVKLVDNVTNMPERISVSPGEYFFGVAEPVFTNSAFAAQASEIRPDTGAVRESLENMISSADENISVRRAADALEKARVKLLHKNRGGGEIYELEGQIESLEDSLEENKEKSARLIRSEVSLSDVKEKLGAARKRSSELEESHEALSLIDAGAKLDRVDAAREKLAEARVRLDAEAGGGADESFVSSLAVAVRDIDRYGKLKAEYAEKQKNFEGVPELSPEDDALIVRSLMKRSGVFFAVSMVVLIFGLFGFVASAFFPMLAILVGTAVLAAVGVVMLFLHFSAKRKAYNILDEWDVDDEEELENLAVGGVTPAELAEDKAALDAAERSAREASGTLDALAETAGLGERARTLSATELVKALGKYAAEGAARKKALEADCSRLEGQLAESEASVVDLDAKDIREKLSALLETEAGRRTAAMTQEERAAAERERTFNLQKAEMLRDKEIELERECAALRAECPAPADAAERLSAMRARLSSMKHAHSAYVLALETLTAASEGIRSSVVPRLTEEASAILSRITDGRYRRLGMSAGFDMSFRTEGFGTKELEYLSTGTRDGAYLALRLALVKALYEPERRPPVIFDESFAYFDEGRVKAALEMLSKDDTQTFLFTCRSLEGNAVSGVSVTHLPSPSRR